MHNFFIVLSRKGHIVKLCLLFIFFSSSLGYAQSGGYTQSVQFSKDSIPMVDGEVIFSVHFDHKLSKKEFFRRSYFYLNGKMNPYTGKFLINNEDSIACTMTDYLEIDSNFLSVFAMYMTYNLGLTYNDGNCIMVISDISYMDKEYFESQEKNHREVDIPQYSGKEIMIDGNYKKILTRNASERITEATLDRINEIIKNMDLAFIGKL